MQGSAVQLVSESGKKGLKNIDKVVIDERIYVTPYNSLKTLAFQLKGGCDILTSDGFLLDGEVRFLSNVCDIVINGEDVNTFIPGSSQVYQLELNGKISGITLQVGGEMVSNEVMIGYPLLNNDGVFSLIPFPFRDESFDNVMIFDILDFSLIEEAERVLKRNGKAYLIVKDKSINGVDPVEATKVFSYRFAINLIRERKKHWIIEGKKRYSHQSIQGTLNIPEL